MSDKEIPLAPVESHALMHVPEPPPMPHLPAEVTGGGITSAFVGMIWALLAIRKRYFRDSGEINQTREENLMLKKAIAERDVAWNLWQGEVRVRAKNAEMVGRLTAEVKALRETNEQMHKDMNVLQQQIGELHHEIAAMKKGN